MMAFVLLVPLLAAEVFVVWRVIERFVPPALDALVDYLERRVETRAILADPETMAALDEAKRQLANLETLRGAPSGS